MDSTVLTKLAESDTAEAVKLGLIARSLGAAIDINREDFTYYGFSNDGETVGVVDTLFTEDELKVVHELFQLFSPFFDPNYEV